MYFLQDIYSEASLAGHHLRYLVWNDSKRLENTDGSRSTSLGSKGLTVADPMAAFPYAFSLVARIDGPAEADCVQH